MSVQQPDISLNTPPAYDFHEGNLRIWADGDIVATFSSQYFPNMILALVTQLKDELRD